MALPEWQTSNSSSLLIYRPRKDERLSRPSWLTYSGRYTYKSGHTSTEDRAEARESSPVTDRRSNHYATNNVVMETSLFLQVNLYIACRGHKLYKGRGHHFTCRLSWRLGPNVSCNDNSKFRSAI